MKKIEIYNRWYLGNKHKLLTFIKEVIDNNCENINTVADLFAGTGSFCELFLNKDIITNDLLYSNYICNYAFLGSDAYNEKKIKCFIQKYNNLEFCGENYMTDNFSNTYLSFEDCSKVGFIREDIECQFKNNLLNYRERAILITSLLYAVDEIARTFGHYDAYKKSIQFKKHLNMKMLNIKATGKNNICLNKDINEIIKNIKADLVYLDPPYNKRQYSDLYHLLENVAKWEKPKVFGVTKKMDRTSIKSKYSSKKATEEFKKLIDNIDAKYILLSYNNMENKGSKSSQATMFDNDIIKILKEKGELKIFEQNYKAYKTNTGNANKNNKERLFLCKIK